jgi:hypothetical protein
VSVELPERGREHPSNSVNSVREGRPEMGRAVEFLWKATGGFEPMIRDLNPVSVNILVAKGVGSSPFGERNGVSYSTVSHDRKA